MELAHLVVAVSSLARFMSRLARDRLVHFALAGGLLFALAPAVDHTRVSLSRDYLQSLHAAQARRLGVPELSDERAAEVDRRALEDEVLYREAVRLGLDRDDGLVREHLIQKMLLLAEDLGGASREPTRDEVKAYFDKTRDRWQKDERVHLVHVFATRRETAEGLSDALRAADALHPDVAPPLGEAFARSRDVRGSREDFASSYGERFADTAFASVPGQWSEPVESRYGWHRVKVLQHTPGAPAAFDDVFERVRLEYAVVHRHEATARFLEQAFQRYHVDVDGAPVRHYEPTARLALRSGPSQED
jgi:peptidyl-prolyl cis-trans isomerase C